MDGIQQGEHDNKRNLRNETDSKYIQVIPASDSIRTKVTAVTFDRMEWNTRTSSTVEISLFWRRHKKQPNQTTSQN